MHCPAACALLCSTNTGSNILQQLVPSDASDGRSMVVVKSIRLMNSFEWHFIPSTMPSMVKPNIQPQ